MPKGKDINAFLLEPKIYDSKEDSNTRDEYLLKIIDEVFSDKDIEVKTDLSIRQINAITKGQLFAERYNCDIMNKLCKKNMTLSVSKNRLSRKEFTDISKSMNAPVEDDIRPTLKTRLLGE